MYYQIIIGILTLSQFASAGGGGDVGGHGGDGLRFIFHSSRDFASSRVLKAGQRADKNKNPEIAKWMDQNGKEMAADILATKHEWTEKEVSTCARTDLNLKAPLQLSFSKCENVSYNQGLAQKILIHESVHHMGIADEQFADSVAAWIYDSTEPEYECTITRTSWVGQPHIPPVLLKKFDIDSKAHNGVFTDLGNKRWVAVEYDKAYLGIHFGEGDMLQNNVTSFNYVKWGDENFIASNRPASVYVNCMRR